MKTNFWIPPKYGTQYPNAVEKHNAIAEQYENQYRISYWKLYDRLTWDHMSEFILQHAQGRDVLLDAGGGTGRWSRELLSLGIGRSEVIDLAEKMMEQGKIYAEKAGLQDRITFSKHDIVSLPFADCSFDIVISQGNPVSYCSDPFRAVGELARVAKRGAPVIISVHSKMAMMNYFCFLTGKISIDQAMELHETSRVVMDYPVFAFTPDLLRSVCEENGLEVCSLIGKPCISGFVQSDAYLKILDDPEGFEKTVALEKLYWEDSNCIGLGGHLQIACLKR